MPLDVISSMVASPVVRSEFAADFDAERARKLRTRLTWFCGVMIFLGMLSFMGNSTDVWGVRVQDRPPLVQICLDLAISSVVVLGHVLLLFYVHRPGRTRRQLVLAYTVAEITVCLLLIALTPLTDNQSFIPGASTEPTMAAAIAQQWVILLTLIVIHVISAVLVATTLRESLWIVAPLTVAYAIQAFAHPHLPAWAAYIFVLIGIALAAPSVFWSWWSYRRFQETFHGTALSRRYDEIAAELTQARQVHEALFPPPITRGGVRLAYQYEPMRQIGGDFLFAHPLSFPPTAARTHLSVVVIDVTGHGVSAALAVNRLYVELKRIYDGDVHPDPASAMRELNDFAHSTLAPQGMYATALIVQAEMDDGRPARVRWCNAGHPPAMLRRAGGQVQHLDSGAPMLGVLEAGAFEPEGGEAALFPGDVVLAYTDGALEAVDGRGEQLGIEGIERVLGECAAEPGSAAKSVIARVGQHRRGPTRDDVLVVEMCAVGAA